MVLLVTIVYTSFEFITNKDYPINYLSDTNFVGGWVDHREWYLLVRGSKSMEFN